MLPFGHKTETMNQTGFTGFYRISKASMKEMESCLIPSILSKKVKMKKRLIRCMAWPLGLKLVFFWIVLEALVGSVQFLYWATVTQDLFPHITLRGTYALAVYPAALLSIILAMLFCRRTFVGINLVAAIVHMFVTLHINLDITCDLLEACRNHADLRGYWIEDYTIWMGWNAFIFLAWALVFWYLMRYEVSIRRDETPTPNLRPEDRRSETMTREIIQPKSVHSTEGVGYSHVARVGDTVYIAGQVALNRFGILVGEDDIEAQAQQAFENLQSILNELGGSLNDIAKMTTYLTDRSQLDAFRRVRNRYLSDPFPPNTLLFISGLAQPKYLIEIEAVASLTGPRAGAATH